jgi:hypothetical protein
MVITVRSDELLEPLLFFKRKKLVRARRAAFRVYLDQLEALKEIQVFIGKLIFGKL